MNILVIADIVGRPGRRAIKGLLPGIQKQENIDFVIANAENAAGGRGLTRQVMNELLGSGIDVLTMGNHVWDNKEIYSFVDDEFRLVRPVNFPPYCPGQGYHVYTGGINKKIAVINAMGRIFLPPLDCPFRTVEQVIEEVKELSDIIIIDFHAEATSEKLAMGYYLDGKVTAVLGTHTHIQTADERILPRGTAYITDLGMTGPQESILGMDKDMVINKIIYQRPVRLEVAGGTAILQGVILRTDDSNNQVREIIRVSSTLP
ncbi:MAG: TIGR00282 family metallophosphoesterase [Methanocorpusculum sp.]|nr:TIGR00282 family metallophosphoesterase [Methanocorpusculum sp.]